MRNIIKKILREELQRPIPKMVFESRTKKGLLVEGTNTVPEMDFQKFYEDNWDKMLNTVCMKYTKDRNKAEDFCQNGFIKVYKNLHKYDDSGSLEAWVSRVINNNILDELRKKKMNFVDGEDGFDFSRLDVGEEEYEEEGISINDIKKVLPQLSPAYKKTFELYYLDGLKHDEIAEELGVSPNTSKTNLMKAKRKIRELLGI
jgi:RNA polymerase sigma-70 factor (ECF subfamily)